PLSQDPDVWSRRPALPAPVESGGSQGASHSLCLMTTCLRPVSYNPEVSLSIQHRGQVFLSHDRQRGRKKKPRVQRTEQPVLCSPELWYKWVRQLEAGRNHNKALDWSKNLGMNHLHGNRGGQGTWVKNKPKYRINMNQIEGKIWLINQIK
uniref:Uncharacterized protein n=1 Tax=Xiphophorus maculatus TaxID=8083 RepID=A0A3B5PX95_XIPMA